VPSLPIIGGLARAVAWHAGRGPEHPDPRREPTAPNSMPWHVRTLILPIPGGQVVNLLFANLITGRVGIEGFDDDPPLHPGAHAGHLALLAMHPDGSRLESIPFDAGAAFQRSPPDALHLDGGRFTYRLEGTWPRYEIDLQVPAWELRVACRVDTTGPLHWWSQAHPLYSHYSAFGHTDGQITLGSRTQRLDGPISLEHGCGGNLRHVPGRPDVPASMFHYQAGVLASGELFALGCFRAMGVEWFRRGVIVGTDGQRTPLTSWRMQDVQTATIDDRCRGQMQVPVSFELLAEGPDVALTYRTEPLAEPSAGRGRLTGGGALLEGTLRRGEGTETPVSGVVYLEHLYRDGDPAVP